MPYLRRLLPPRYLSMALYDEFTFFLMPMIVAAFPCPFLREEVELTHERLEHIRSNHPEFAAMVESVLLATIREALQDPMLVLQSRKDENARIFAKWDSSLYGGKYVIVTVIASPERNWIITAFISRYQPKGVVLWARD